MAEFTYRFTIPASVEEVAAFHSSTEVLSQLAPPPIFIQIHEAEPLAEGAEARFTMWFGPIPARWRARHSDVGPGGFTDEQVEGPLESWRHRHSFVPLDESHTRIEEQIQYEHRPGLPGLLTRLAFNPVGLQLLFTYRQLVTRLALRPADAPERSIPWRPLALALGAVTLFVAGRRLSRKRVEEQR